MTAAQHAAALRAGKTTHYNCAQSVLIPYAEQLGMTQEQARALAENFGAGMRHGATCGAVTGALMVLGALGYREETARQFLQTFRAQQGELTCEKLLKLGEQQGLEKKAHCDSLVVSAVELVEQLRR